MSGRKKIIIAGSTGYVGQELLKEFVGSNEFDIVGISRSGISRSNIDNYAVKKANLFSLKEAESAMEGGDIGIFLVHSMLPNNNK